MQLISTPDAGPARGHYSQAVVHGGWVYVSGQLPVGASAPLPATAPFEQQARQVLENIEAILRASGSDPSHIVKTNVYVTDIAHWPQFDALYAVDRHAPTRAVRGAGAGAAPWLPHRNGCGGNAVAAGAIPLMRAASLDVFAISYAQARHQFCAQAELSRGRLATWTHPSVSGPDGEALHTDVASFGDVNAPTVLIVSSGTHGIEGYTGSAAQADWMRSGLAQRVPAGIAVVLVHAVNPWGFAHGHRVNESNIDLNRNFADFDQPLRPNPGYAELHPHLCIADWTEPEIARAFEAMEAFRSRAGEQAFSDAFNGGQHTHADGIFYGGLGAAWSNETWREIIATHAGRASRVALIDVHTGIGAYGQPFFANFDTAGSPGHARVQRWWGERAVNRAGLTHAAFATYSGVLIDALEPALPRAECTAMVVEFGTQPRQVMQRAHLGLMWSRRHPDADAAAMARFRGEYVEAFYPADLQWRRSVLTEARSMLDAGLAGLSDW